MRIWQSVVCVALFSGFSYLPAAPWLEAGDTGSLPESAQKTSGVGALTLLAGDLVELADIDLYWILIKDPSLFSAATIDAPGFLVPDPQLFLFDHLGFGVYSNDDASDSQSELPSGSLFSPTLPGRYLLGIGRFNNEPLSTTGLIFTEDIGINGPDLSAGGASPLVAWDGNVSGRPDLDTRYLIAITGAEFAVPEPGSFLLVCAGTFAVWIMRRAGRIS